MTDTHENTWFRRNLVGVLIVTLLGLAGFTSTFMYNSLKADIQDVRSMFRLVLTDHETRIRQLEHATKGP